MGIEPADEPTAARFLSPAEELTARGELLLAAPREADARALFERALAADPHSAVAKEALRRLDGTPRLYPRTGPDDADAVLEARCKGGAHMDCVELGQRFREGTGRAPDLTRAASLFLGACAAGEPEGCAQEGWAFEFGKGVVRDLARAAAAYERACDTGREWGCVRLGLLHEQGQGVARDPARAFALYTQACDDGSSRLAAHESASSTSRGAPRTRWRRRPHGSSAPAKGATPRPVACSRRSTRQARECRWTRRARPSSSKRRATAASRRAARRWQARDVSTECQAGIAEGVAVAEDVRTVEALVPPFGPQNHAVLVRRLLLGTGPGRRGQPRFELFEHGPGLVHLGPGSGDFDVLA